MMMTWTGNKKGMLFTRMRIEYQAQEKKQQAVRHIKRTLLNVFRTVEARHATPNP